MITNEDPARTNTWQAKQGCSGNIGTYVAYQENREQFHAVLQQSDREKSSS